jgi:hypothetical protein
VWVTETGADFAVEKWQKKTMLLQFYHWVISSLSLRAWPNHVSLALSVSKKEQ